MIYGITYIDDKFTQSGDLCMKSMLKNGVDVVQHYHSGYWIRANYVDSFYSLNSNILDAKRGGGYWLWKPFIISEKMREINDGDILIYSDAGIEFVNNVHHIIDKMDEDIFFFTNGFPHVEWCKGDVLNEILNWNMSLDGLNEAERITARSILHLCRDFTQVQASVMFFRVNQKTRDFVKEWLLWCQMPGFIDDSPSKLPNYPTFAEHRHDQSVVTCLQIKYGYKLHFWPTNYSEHIRHTAQPGDDYPTIFNHHRKRNEEW